MGGSYRHPSPRPESFHLAYVAAALIQRDLDCSFQSLLIVPVEFGEFERLLNPGDWRQHFDSAEDRSVAGKKHELYLGALIQGLVQTQQAAGGGDDLKSAQHTAAIFTAQHGMGDFYERRARGSLRSGVWGRDRHLA